MPERIIRRRHGAEEGEAGTEFQIVRSTEDRVGGFIFVREYGGDAFAQACTENRVGEISGRLRGVLQAVVIVTRSLNS